MRAANMSTAETLHWGGMKRWPAANVSTAKTSAAEVCAGHRRLIPGQPGKLYLFAVYCRNDQYMSQTTAWTDATGPDDPRVARMFAVLFQVLFTDQPVHRFDRGPFGFPMVR